ncbi:MAG: chromate transporter [Streptosporangiaceae bacterium]
MEHRAGLGTVVREWGRIGCVGFGGPPAHIALLRQLCVERRRWLDAQEFEDAIAACNLLPGPASTELAIFCAWRVRGRVGALAGGLAFILPGLACILALSALFLAGTPPLWVKGAGAGAGAAVAAVAVQAGWTLLRPSWARAGKAGRARQVRWAAYLLAGGAAAATIGPWLVLILLGCGLGELAGARARDGAARPAGTAVAGTAVAGKAVAGKAVAGEGTAGEATPGEATPGEAAAGEAAAGEARGKTRGIAVLPGLLAGAGRMAGAAGGGGLAGVAWVAFKVGALSFGGGFVIIPLMQAHAVGRHWMTAG